MSVVVLVIKYAAHLLTCSFALYSDALESIIDVATAVAAIIANRIAAAPADAEHPHGQSKAEYISAGMVGALIIVAALAILREAQGTFQQPTPIETPWKGLAVSLLATVLIALWSLNLIRQGSLNRSAALVAHGKYLMADVVTPGGVFVGVVLTGILQLDAAIAALVALHVL